MFPGLHLHHADPPQQLIVAGQDLDDLQEIVICWIAWILLFESRVRSIVSRCSESPLSSLRCIFGSGHQATCPLAQEPSYDHWLC